ncbi:MAG: hypothetical protein DMD82_14535 [Candidatus Rokuibacteriota bacterium]|nr:MAG: hypothetical protein DMD82_14535 [Candidatus Rokubacteria bacterium]
MTTISRRHAHEAGFTLAELLVTIAVLGLIMAAVLGIYTVTQRSTSIGTAAEDAQVVTRVTLETIVTDLQLINAGRPTSAGAITTATATSLTLLGDVDNDTLDATGNNATVNTTDAAAGATQVHVSSTQGFSVNELVSLQYFGTPKLMSSGAISETQQIASITGPILAFVPPGKLSNSYPKDVSIVRSVETVTYNYTNVAGGTLTRTIGALAPDTLATNCPTFQLTYWQGSVPSAQILNPSTQALRDQIKEIRISLACRAQSGDQTAVRTMTTTVRPRNL